MQTNLFTRPDTLLGVCEGLGEDLGTHPNLLRVSLAGLLFWNPAAAIVTYVGAGAIVALSRWIFPNPRIVVPGRGGPARRGPARRGAGAAPEGRTGGTGAGPSRCLRVQRAGEGCQVANDSGFVARSQSQ
jgi:phage shock protein PspC (stress-responsive transcriptional regulator)